LRALLFHGPGDLRLEEVPRPEPAPGDVLVQVEVALTDGTDAKTFLRGHPLLLQETPSPFGHEFCGVDVATGRRVVAANSAPCGECAACIPACPTDAIVAAYELDSNKCISYLTIEKRGPISEELREGMGHQVFGCDICQDVCPWNRKAPATDKPEFQPREGLVNPALAWLAEISVEEFRNKFRGSPVKRAKHSGLRRNVLIAIGNSGEPTLLPVAERASNDPDPVIAEAAQWAKRRLTSNR